MNRAGRLVHRGQEVAPDGTIVGDLPPTKTLGFRWSAFQNTFTDAGQPMVCRRSFPHIVDELREITISEFTVDMQTGTISGSSEIPQSLSPFSNGFSNGFGPLTQSTVPQIGLRVSKDGGATFGNYRLKSLISAGHNRTMLRWRGIGMGRDLVFEVTWSAPMATGLNQAYARAVKHAA
jgi:hypothetical protein